MYNLLKKDDWNNIIYWCQFKDILHLSKTCKYLYNIITFKILVQSFFKSKLKVIKYKIDLINNSLDIKDILLSENLIQHCLLCRHYRSCIGIGRMNKLDFIYTKEFRFSIKKLIMSFYHYTSYIDVNLNDSSTWKDIYLSLTKNIILPIETESICDFCSCIHYPIFLLLSYQCHHSNQFNEYSNLIKSRSDDSYTAYPLCKIKELSLLCK